jgi:hypothetical protein
METQNRMFLFLILVLALVAFGDGAWVAKYARQPGNGVGCASF